MTKAVPVTTYENPVPVSVLLLPVRRRDGRVGVLVGLRNIEPSKGRYALPGGYVEISDISIEAAAVRETKEEMGVDIDPGHVKLSHSFSTGHQMLVFSISSQVVSEDEVNLAFTPSLECADFRVCVEPEDLAFQSHTDALAMFLGSSLSPSASTTTTTSSR